MDLKSKIRIIEDFPVKGISFKDITTLLKDKDALRASIDALAELAVDPVDYVVAPEARGFIFATALAYKINAGFVPIRKPGKLPGETVNYKYELEYGTDEIQIHKDAVEPGDKVIIVDDLLATGGTLYSCAKLVESLGGKVDKIMVLMELTELGGRDKLKDYNVCSLMQYPH